MKLTEVLEQWLGVPSSLHANKSKKSSSGSRPQWDRICEDLGEEVSPEAIESLASRGLSEAQIGELLSANNTLHSRWMDDLDYEVDRMFAESTLKKYGYQDADQFMRELISFREMKS